MDQPTRSFRAQLDDREAPKPPVPFRHLRTAYRMARDTWKDNADQPETVRDYWPTCIEMVLWEHGLIEAEDCKLI